MKFLTNIIDPNLGKEKMYPFNCSSLQELELLWKERIEWLQDKVIGEPQVAEVEGAVSLEQLKRENIVGVYEK